MAGKPAHLTKAATRRDWSRLMPRLRTALVGDPVGEGVALFIICLLWRSSETAGACSLAGFG
jgi:hypothetical protein